MTGLDLRKTEYPVLGFIDHYQVTCRSVPVQVSGVLLDGRVFYFRYRSGIGSLGVGTDEFDAAQDAARQVDMNGLRENRDNTGPGAAVCHGDFLDGWLDDEEVSMLLDALMRIRIPEAVIWAGDKTVQAIRSEQLVLLRALKRAGIVMFVPVLLAIGLFVDGIFFGLVPETLSSIVFVAVFAVAAPCYAIAHRSLRRLDRLAGSINSSERSK